MAAITEELIDKLIRRLDTACEQVLAAQGSTVKLESAELDLLSVVGDLRDALRASLRTYSRGVLNEIFAGSCTQAPRVAHIKSVLTSLDLSPNNASDQRLRGCVDACTSVQQVACDHGLKDVLREAEEVCDHGLKDVLKEAEDGEKRALASATAEGEEEVLANPSAPPAKECMTRLSLSPVTDATPEAASGAAAAAGSAAEATTASGCRQDNDAAEVLGSSSEEDCAQEADLGREVCQDIFREGAEVVVLDGGDDLVGLRGTLVAWEDVGGPFGQWVICAREAAGGAEGRTLRLHPSHLCLASEYFASGGGTVL